MAREKYRNSYGKSSITKRVVSEVPERDLLRPRLLWRALSVQLGCTKPRVGRRLWGFNRGPDPRLGRLQRPIKVRGCWNLPVSDLGAPLSTQDHDSRRVPQGESG